MGLKKKFAPARLNHRIVRCALGGDAIRVVRQLHLPQRARRAAHACVVCGRGPCRDRKIRKRIQQRLRFRAPPEHLVQQPELQRRITARRTRGHRLQDIFGLRVAAAIDLHARARHGSGSMLPCAYATRLSWPSDTVQTATATARSRTSTPRERLGSFIGETIIRPGQARLPLLSSSSSSWPWGLWRCARQETPSTDGKGSRSASGRSCSDVVIHADEVIA